jgi:hypothetical protein
MGPVYWWQGVLLMRVLWLVVLGTAAALAQAAPSETPSSVHWHISGMLAEACSCSPPCTCNFGLGAGPHDFCYSVFSYAIKAGEYDSVVLDGMMLSCAQGQRGYVWYIDSRATPAQAEALRAIAVRIAPGRHAGPGSKRGYVPPFVSAAITQEVTDHGSRLQIEGAGGFDNTYLLGMDGKTPVIVLNNTSFNLKRSMKGRTGTFRYKDRFGNDLDYKGTNTNTGEFDYDQDTKTIRG